MNYKRRLSDQSKIVSLVDNPWARLIHQLLSWGGAIAIGTFGWLFLHYTNGVDVGLIRVTDAVNILTSHIEGKFGSYDDHFVQNDRRLDRLENTIDKKR